MALTDKTKAQLIEELEALQAKVATLEQAEVRRDQAESLLEVLWLVAEQSASSIAILDAEGIVEYANPKLLEAYQAKPEDIVGKHWQSFLSMHSSLREHLQEMRGAVFEGGTTWAREVTDISKEDEVVWREARIFPVRDASGELTHTVYQSEDITKRKRAEEALRESEKRFRLLAENSPDYIYIFDLAQRRAMYFNRDEFIGYGADEIYGQNSLLDYLHPEDKEVVLQHWQQLLSGEWCEPSVIEYRLRNRRGDWEWIQSRETIIPGDTPGRLPQILFTLTVITDRKRAEENLRESEEKFRNLAEQSPNMIFINKRGRVVYANQRSAEVMGYKREELYAPDFDFRTLTAPESAEVVEATFAKHMAGEDVEPYEHALVTRDGRRIEVISAPKLITYEGENAILGIVTDITERKRAEEVLRESQALLEATIESLPFDFFAIGPDGRYILQNSVCRERWGNVIGTRPEDAAPDEDTRALWLDNNRRAFNGEEIRGEVEYTVDGERGYYHNIVVPLRNEGEIRGILGVNIDITERKQAEEAYRSLVDHSLQALLIVQDGRIVFANPAITETSGYTIEELLDLSPEGVQGLIHPEDRELIWERAQKRLAGEQVPEQYEFRFVRKDGSVRWVEQYTGLIEYKGKPAAQTAYVDITERKQAEELIRAQRDLALKLSAALGLEEALRLCAEAAIQVTGLDGGGIYLVDEKTGDLNLAFTQGLSDDFVRSTSFIEKDDPRARIVRAGEPVYTRHRELGVPIDEPRRREGLRALAIVPVVHEGEVIACLNLASHTLDDIPEYARQALETIASQIGSTITRVRAREALLRLSNAVKMSTDAIVISDLDGTIIDVNEAGLRMYGTDDKADLIGKDSFELVAPEDRERALADGAVVLKEGSNKAQEYRVLRKNGETYPAEISTAIMKNAAGEPVGLVGVLRDITERRRIEEQLRQHAIQLMLINEIGGQIAAVLDLDGVLDMTARLVHERFGYEHVSLLTVDHKREELMVKAKAGSYAVTIPDDYQFKMGEGIVGWVAQQGESLLANDVSTEPRYRNFFPEEVVRAELSVPIKVGGETVGVLDVQRPELNAFNANDVRVMETLADQLAAAIHNAQLFEAEQHERALAQTLQRTAETLAGSVSLEYGLKYIVDQLREVVHYDYALVMIAEEDRLRLKVSHGFPAEAQIPETYSYPEHPELHKIMSAGEMVVLSDVQWDPSRVSLPGITPSTRSWIGVPLIAKEVGVGFMGVGNDRPDACDKHDVEAILAFAQQAALAIENAWVHAELETSLTDLHEAQSHLMRAARLSAAGKLAAGVAHQVNNPLTTIIAQAHLLLNRLSPESSYYKSVETINRAAHQAGVVVQRLLDFARSTPYVMQPVDINLSIQDSVSLIRAQTDPRVVQFNTQLASNLPSITASKQHLEDVWINLLLNARDAVGGLEGKGIAEVSTAFDADENAIVVTVRDNGAGILPEHQELIFDPFFTTKKHGTGLGLSICYDIVAHHNGAIHVASEAGQGTTFTITLPVD